MKISILLITYNQENYIQECINGILMQEIPFDYEVIVADDFSSDNTLILLKNTLSDKVKNFQILETTQNFGISKNYQRGFAACKGEYIAVIEGDDYWNDPQRLIKHIDFLNNHQECVLTMNRFIIYYHDLGKSSIRDWNASKDYQYITTSQMAEGNKLGNLSACIIRKSEINKVKPDLYDLEIADWMLGMVLSENGIIAILKGIMSVYRIHNEGLWSKMTAKTQINKTLLLIDLYNHYLEYRYDLEFNINKQRLKESLMKKTSYFDIYNIIPLKIRKALKLYIKSCS